MSESSWKEEAVRQSSQWLDTDGDAPIPDQESSADHSLLVHMADLQLIDALLTNMSEPAGVQNEQRIRAAMDAIDQPTPTRATRGRFRRWYPLAAIAAGLLITCVAFWLQFSHESLAEELLHKISEVSLENTDRVYNLKRITSTSSSQRERDGKLYLRGVDGFVVESGKVVFGRHDNEFWFVAVDGSAVVAEDFEWLVAHPDKHGHEIALLKELSIESRHVPLMELSSVVTLMQQDYDVELRSETRFGQRRVDELVGQRRSATSELPNTIRLWSGKDSQVIYRAEFSWEQGEEEAQKNRLVLELRSPEVVPDNWYRHDAHRTGDQPVRRISSGS